jgi:hypothetical protein
LSRCTGRALVLIALFPTACPILNNVPCSTYVSGLQLRGGGDAVRSTAVLKKVASMVDTLAEDEVKPDHSLKRHASRLVLEETQLSNTTNPTDSTAAPLKEKVLYRCCVFLCTLIGIKNLNTGTTILLLFFTLQ